MGFVLICVPVYAHSLNRVLAATVSVLTEMMIKIFALHVQLVAKQTESGNSFDSNNSKHL
ncbi:MAG: hypothetical protein AB1489_25135 [Acidobacteriota bacterium]